MERKMNTHTVIMAGGAGSRLWPVSRPEMPKQFMDMLGTGKTLIQMTAERFESVCPAENFWVVTSDRYAETVRRQLPQIRHDHILTEPEPRNTAPCIAYACWKIGGLHPDANIIVTPSDALILDTECFTSCIRKALDFTENRDAIVTVGITPSRPETGYGYICAPGAAGNEISKVKEFREKPDLRTAEAYLRDGGFFWNAGIFVWNAATIASQMRAHAPQIASVMDGIARYFGKGNEREKIAELFPLCEKISIDYAVMEKSENIYMIPCNPLWSDLGSWGAVKGHIAPDACGNSVVGDDVRLSDCRNCIVHAAGEGTLIAEGLDGYIVARNGNDVLVCRISEEQRIKEFLNR